MPSPTKARQRDPAAAEQWGGRFPRNDIISLLDVNRIFNLAESTAQDLTVGDLLDLPAAQGIRHLKLGYGSSAGSLDLRREVAIACNVTPEDVVTMQGTALGSFLLAMELCRPGDEAILVTPGFPPNRDCLTTSGAQVHEVKLDFDSGYELTLERLLPLLSPATKLVSFSSPQNPSGVQVPIALVARLVVELEKRAPSAFLFIDETYREATYYGNPAIRSFAGIHKRVITSGSVSKAMGAPGLRTGWLTIRDADLRERILVAKMNVVISGSVLDEALAAALLMDKEQILAAKRRFLHDALLRMQSWCHKEQARLEWVPPDAGAMCCVRLRPEIFSEARLSRFWKLLPTFELQLASGTWFGDSEHVLRIGFGYLPLERLDAALAALSIALDASKSYGSKPPN